MCEFYYGVKPRLSYFRGLSTGGRQGLVAAQRFPADFDGIISGSPALNLSSSILFMAWVAKLNRYPNGTSILKAADFQILEEASRNACDGNDGVLDRIVDPSYKCTFDPATILCGLTNTTAKACLNEDQVNVANGFYHGPQDSKGNSLGLGRINPGAESALSLYATDDTSYSAGYLFGQSGMASAIFEEDLPLSFSLEDFDWDNIPPVSYMESFYSGTNADMSVFKRRGGKMIILDGWQDHQLVPQLTLEWYQR